MCHLSHVFFIIKKIYPLEKNGQSGGASRWRVCYQRGLPRLVNRPGVARAAPQKKHKHLFWFPLKDFKIKNIFLLIQKFVKA